MRRRVAGAGGTVHDVAVELGRRWRFRPRAAYRHAFGWSQAEVAARFRAVAEQLRTSPEPTSMPTTLGSRIGEYERWPHGGRRPSPYVLAVLSAVYGTTVERLIDSADLEAMPARDRAVITALVERQRVLTVEAPDRNHLAYAHRSSSTTGSSNTVNGGEAP